MEVQPILLHPRINAISGDISDLFDRLDIYGDSFKKAGGKHPLLVYCAMDPKAFQKLDLVKFTNLEIVRVCNSASFIPYFIAKAFFHIISRKIKPSILVAGDLKLALFVSLVLKFLLLGKVRVQVSLHGKPSVGRYSKSKSISALYVNILRVSFIAVNSVRVVSDDLANFAQVELKVKSPKIFVCPVPIIVQPKFIDKRHQNPTIGVVGRLHSERGTEAVLEILTALLRIRPRTQVIFIGGGELSLVIQNWIRINNYSDTVKNIGELSQSSLQTYWSKINILLSAAPAEGYGLALREALISGAVVVAKRSEGTLALLDEFEVGVTLFDNNPQAIEILADHIEKLNTVALAINAGKIQLRVNEKALSRLAQSWKI